METEEQLQEPAADEAGAQQDLVGGRLGDAEISGLIRRVRRLVKVSQRELAQVLGVSRSAVAKWETGRTLGPSADLGLPRVRYSRWWQLGRAPTLADVQDHPTWGEVPIPEWAFVDTWKSRNRWPDEFRAHARAASVAVGPRARGQTWVRSQA